MIIVFVILLEINNQQHLLVKHEMVMEELLKYLNYHNFLIFLMLLLEIDLFHENVQLIINV